MVSSPEPQAGGVGPQGPLALVVSPQDSQKLAHFCLETYRQNLQTDLLGRTLLYAEVATTTMDLLEG